MTFFNSAPLQPQRSARHATLGLGLLILFVFAVKPLSATTYYVNDSATTNDLWCSAVGNDGSDGLTTNTPKATVQSVIDTYTLTGGDQVRIDTGVYNLTADITVTSADSGTSINNPVHFIASPYGVTFDRGDTTAPNTCFNLNGAFFIHVTTTNDTSLPSVSQRFLQLTGAERGLSSTGRGNRFNRLEAVSNLFYGIVINGTAASNNVVENCLLRDTTAGTGLYLGSTRAAIRNCTFADNAIIGLRLVGATFANLTNNLLSASGTGSYALFIDNTSTFTANGNSDYNLFWATNGATLAQLNTTNLTSLSAWRAITSRDASSLERDPLFVNPTTGNYHLQSTAGSYHEGGFTTDLLDSPGIDTGWGTVGFETSGLITTNETPLHPTNTGKRNLGAYGGTEQASRTPTQRYLYLYAPLGGDQYLNQATPLLIRWTWVGTAWASGDQTLALDYRNESNSFAAVSGAGAVAVNAGSFSWNTASLLPTPLYQVRLTRNVDPNVVATSGDFRIGRNIVYYVNDTNTLHDLWSTTTGSDTNNALTPGFPKATVQSVIDTYVLAGGDQVRLDTGLYNLTNDVTVTSAHSGVATALVSFVASPYGVTFDRGDTNGTAACWFLNSARFVQLTTTNDATAALTNVPQRLLQLTGANRGFWSTGQGNRLSRVETASNSLFGVAISGAAGTNNLIENCLLRDTTDPTAGVGLQVGSARATVRNCTIVGNGRYGLRLVGATFANLTNNILTANGTGTFALHLTSSSFSGSDFNLFWATNVATLAQLNGTNLTTLSAWRTATGRDANSLERDPLFVDPTAGDYHLQSTAGSYHGGAFTNDLADSPGIDTGFGDIGWETSSLTATNQTPLHPASTGKRNLGTYGGTEQASRTPTNRYVYLYAPLATDEYLNQAAPLAIRWTWVGTDWGSGDQTLALDYRNESNSFVAVSGASAVAVNAGSFSWPLTGLLPTPLYQLRVTRNIDATLVAASGGDFRIGRNIVYYVNDSATTNDLWCSTSGDDANNGLTPGFPKATVQSVIDTYTLAGGDQVRLDTGLYNLTNDVTVTSAHSGVATALVSFVASPYGVTFDRGDTNGTAACWFLNSAAFVQLTTTNDATAALTNVPQRLLQLTGANRGFWSTGQGNRLSRVETASNSLFGVAISGAAGTNNLIENCLLRDTTDPTAGVGLQVGSARATVRNCTIVGNGRYGLRLVGATFANLTNNLLTASGTGSYALHINNTSTFTANGNSDYNLFWATNGATLAQLNGTNLTTLTAWRTNSGRDPSSLQRDPLFVNPTTGDYHLQSTAGSYHDGAFTGDSNDSPGIDTGFGDVGLETSSLTTTNQTPLHPATTGKRNLGAFGGTEQASRTPTQRYLFLYSPLGGESFSISAGPVPVRWTWVGTNWATNDSVALEYKDSLSSFQNVAGASALAVNATPYSWDVAGLARDPGYQLRLTCNQDGGATVTTKSTFSFGGKLVLYVNDNSLVDDKWSSVIGNDANDGTATNRPKATVQATLAAQDLQPGDEVRIDTGLYNLSSDIVIGPADGGTALNPVLFQGSSLGGGTVLNRGNTNGTTAVFDCQASGVVFHSLRLTGGARAIVPSGTAASNSVVDCFIYGNNHGIQLTSTGALTVVNSTIADNALAGIDSTGATNIPRIVNTILWNNGDDLIACQAVYSAIEDGDAGTGNISADPQFLNAGSGDYRLLGASPCIDAGTNSAGLLPAVDIDGQARIFAGIVDIGADERPWSVSLTTSTNTVAENSLATATLTVTRDGSYFRNLDVPFDISGTASNGLDYDQLPSHVTISNGNTTATLPFAPVTDAILEGNETATFTLTNLNTYLLSSTNTGTITIDESTDVVATKTGPATVDATLALSYTVTVSNAGPATAVNVALTDNLPADAVFVSASAGGTLDAGRVVWPVIPSLNAGGASNFTVTINAPPSGLLTNTVASVADTADPDLANNDGSNPAARVLTTVSDTADVATTKSGPATVDAGISLVYSLTVSNAGPSPAANISVTDSLPTGVTFVTASGGGTNANGVIGWPPLASVPAGGTVTLTLTVTPPGEGTLTNYVTSSASTPDPNATNNDGSAAGAKVVTTVIAHADVFTLKTGPGSLYAGTNFTYTVTVTNAGPSTAFSVMVADSLPAGVTFLSASAAGTNASGTVGWPVMPSLPVNFSTNFTVTVAAGTPGVLTNTVASVSVTDDPNSGNNDGTGLGGRVVTVVNHWADIITLKTGPTLVMPGTNISYQLTITNAGPTVATNVTVVDYLPGNVTFVAASAGGTNTAGTIGWPMLPLLGVGEVTNFTVTVTAPLTGSVTNRAANGAAVFDPLLGNNDGTATGATVVTIIDIAADSDSDGLPNWWELTYGLNPADASDAGIDTDGDGFSNLQEYLAGTSPTDGLDALRITTLYADGDDLHIRFTTANGKEYKVDYRNSLESGIWTEIPGVITGDGTELEAVDLGAVFDGSRYYRVRLYLAP